MYKAQAQDQDTDGMRARWLAGLRRALVLPTNPSPRSISLVPQRVLA
jgi:hypothetical protein